MKVSYVNNLISKNENLKGENRMSKDDNQNYVLVKDDMAAKRHKIRKNQISGLVNSMRYSG